MYNNFPNVFEFGVVYLKDAYFPHVDVVTITITSNIGDSFNSNYDSDKGVVRRHMDADQIHKFQDYHHLNIQIHIKK